MNPLFDFENQTLGAGGLLAGLSDPEKLASMATSNVEDRRPFMPQARPPDTESARQLLMLRGLGQQSENDPMLMHLRLTKADVESRNQMANPSLGLSPAPGLADPVALRAMRNALRPDLQQFNRPQVISPTLRTNEVGDTIVTRGLMGLR